MQAGNGKPLRVFWSYSHSDEKLRDKLHDHLTGLRSARLIEDWHDRKIGAGTVWKDEIDRHLDDADIILLLVSASFMASEYCWSDEMVKALSRHKTNQARVIPVILRPCDWMDTPIAELQAVPKDARPITQWTDRDVAYLDVIKAIRLAVTELNTVRDLGLEMPHSDTDPEAAMMSPSPHPDPLPRAGEGDVAEAVVTPLPRPGEGGARCESGGRVRAQPKTSVFIGVDPRELPDLAVFRDGDAPWCPEMVVIPAGSFLMGSPPDEPERENNEGPRHRVTVASRFALGRYAVTFAEYDYFCDVTNREKPADEGWGRGRLPVINVNWRDARDYVEWLSRNAGQPYRLPSEAEWEYACRAGTRTPFSFGRTITTDLANYDGNHPYAGGPKGLDRHKTVAVGTLPANPWGLHEMHGNAWEWVEDIWHIDYADAPAGGSAWTGDEDMMSGAKRVLRGGAWRSDARRVRSAYRLAIEPDLRREYFGFRCARDLES